MSDGDVGGHCRFFVAPGSLCRRAHYRRHAMTCSRQITSLALATMLMVANAAAFAQGDSKYPDWSGQWRRPQGVGVQWDPSKPLGLAQQPPLTPEFQGVFESSLGGQKAGGQGGDPSYTCIPPGMPRAMTVVFPMEIVILPNVTYILQEYASMIRRIYTDGRKIPDDEEPAFLGYSVGQWRDADGDGKFDTLEVETRNMKGPRSFDASGIPLHPDNQTAVKERIYLDKNNKDLLRNEVTTTDNALARPWTVMKTYRRDPNAKTIWFEYVCAENNRHVVLGKENYFVSGDGYLMPARKGQAKPDLKYFDLPAR